MEYGNFGKTWRVILGFSLVFGLATTAWAYPGDNSAGYTTGFWGPVAGPRECDATNEDGICIAWHSVLKGISPARISQCSAWGCDLRPGARTPYRGPYRDEGVAAQLSAQQHDITPVVLDAQGKPVVAKKAAPRATRVEEPVDNQGAYGPIKPLVIEMRTK